MHSTLLQAMFAHVALGTALVGLLLFAKPAFPRVSAAQWHSAFSVVLVLLILLPMLAFVPSVKTRNVADAVVPPTARAIEWQQVNPPARSARTAIHVSSSATTDAGKTDLILLIAWLALAAWQIGQFAKSLRYVARIRRDARPVRGAARSTVDRLALAMGLRGRIAVHSTPAVATPQVAGFLRPTILLPEDWSGARERGELEHVLAHELAHLRRGDHYWAWVQFFARIFLGLNPAVWVAIKQMNTEREMACDDWAVALGNSPKDCATSLLSVAAALTPGRADDLSIPCLRSRTHLRRRITHMLNHDKSHSTRTVGRLTLAAILAGLAGTALAAPPWFAASVDLPDLDDIGLIETRTTRPQPQDGLLYAAWEGHTDQARALLAGGADPDDVYRTRDPRTALVAAARQQNWDIMQLLLDNGADVNKHARGDETPLMAAARHTRPDMVRVLLDQGADPDVRVRGDGAPVISAARGGSAENVRLLLAAGADPAVWVQGDESPMFHAVVNGHSEVVDVLLAAGVSPTARYRGDGTPLMLAIRNGHDELAQTLIAAGADVATPMRGDGTALIDAARRNSVAMVQRLLDAGADVDQQVKGDGNALINAARRGYLETATLLLDRGATVNVHVVDDDTPLINAVWSNNAELVALMLERGADPNLGGDYDKDLGEKRTPLNQAKAGSDVAALLARAGAR